MRRATNILIPVHIRADADVKTGDIYELMDVQGGQVSEHQGPGTPRLRGEEK